MNMFATLISTLTKNSLTV